MAVLQGKRAVVTGSGRGLGRAYAMAMAREGAALVINDVDADEAEKVVTEIKVAGGKAVANGDSIADYKGAGRVIDQCVGEYGGIDVLVNNAGIHHETPIWDETEQEFDKLMLVNLKGTFNTVKHAVKQMMPKRQGCIINVSSGAQSGIIGQTVYGASKAGVAGFTYACAMELAPYNIRVNAISPLAHTRMAEQSRARSRTARPMVPWPPENVAPLCVFLASDDASYVTGQIIRLEGEVLSVFSHPKPVSGTVRPGGWTVEDIRKYFKGTLGQNLEPVGIRAARYEYYEGLTEKK